MAKREKVSHARLLSMLVYDPLTGVFTWRVSRGGCTSGDVVGGCPNEDGYLLVKLDGRVYKAHRLAFFYMTGEWPANDIDHWDRNPANNRWTNLRPATRSQNAANGPRRINNTSGFKGVSLHKRLGKFRADIAIGGKKIYLGLFDDPAEAHAAYCAKAAELYGAFARG